MELRNLISQGDGAHTVWLLGVCSDETRRVKWQTLSVLECATEVVCIRGEEGMRRMGLQNQHCGRFFQTKLWNRPDELKIIPKRWLYVPGAGVRHAFPDGPAKKKHLKGKNGRRRWEWNPWAPGWKISSICDQARIFRNKVKSAGFHVPGTSPCWQTNRNYQPVVLSLCEYIKDNSRCSLSVMLSIKTKNMGPGNIFTLKSRWFSKKKKGSVGNWSHAPKTTVTVVFITCRVSILE